MKYWLRTKEGAKWLWANHIQKSSAAVLGAAATFDLVGYHDSVSHFIGEGGYHGIRIGLAALIFLRATMAQK